MLIEELHIEQIARMLTVERCMELAGIQVLECDKPCFSKTEIIFYNGLHAFHFRLEDNPAGHRRGLDLDGC